MTIDRDIFRTALRTGLRTISRALAALAVLCAVAVHASAQVLLDQLPAQARGLEVEEHLSRVLPLELEFTNDQGKLVRLSDYFGKPDSKPALVAMVYYDCPIVCSVTMDKIAEVANKLAYTVGKDYNILLFTIDYSNTVQMAAQRKMADLAGYDRGEDASAATGWVYHVGEPGPIRSLAEAMGFKYRFMPENGEYAHPVSLQVVSPKGKITRYFHQVQVYDPLEMRLSLLDASEGKIAASIGDRLLSFCYHYDPTAGKYSLKAMRVMQLGGIVTIVFVIGLVGSLRLAELARRRGRAAAALRAAAPPPVRIIVPGAPVGAEAAVR